MMRSSTSFDGRLQEDDGITLEDKLEPSVPDEATCRTNLEAPEQQLFIEELDKHVENDNLKLLKKIRDRKDRVGLEMPTIEVRFKNLSIEVECEVVHGKPLPTLWNSLKSKFLDSAKLWGTRSHLAKISIVSDVSGIIQPGRMTLLLGPPGCGKTSLLKALSGNLNPSLEVKGEVYYNGYKLDEFVPQKTSAYISQNDLHIPEMTVRETLDFSARFQGTGSTAEMTMELSIRENEAGIIHDPDAENYVKAVSGEGLERTLQTDYILKILGLDVCADTLVGNELIRGISGGQRRRLTTGEMIIGPVKALLMDEITNGLDSSTAFQVVSYLQQLVHITDATALISLLQPAPETFDLFDDLVLMAEGRIIYHGPRDHVLEFFENCGFKCPERKGVADFLQEVISKKDQAKYWNSTEQPYNYVSVDDFSRKFIASSVGKTLEEELSKTFDKSQCHKNALTFTKYTVSKWKLFRACMSREILLMRRNSFTYAFKTSQLVIAAIITMTLFLSTHKEIDSLHSNYLMGSLSFALIVILQEGIPEMSMTVGRLHVFYKQKELCLVPAWAYAVPATISKIPLSFVQSLVWTSLTYYVIGYSPEVWRFFSQFILLFAMHLASLSMFRFVGSIFPTRATAFPAASLLIIVLLLFGGFVVSRSSLPVWFRWGFWVCPLTYGETGLFLNEFLAPRWQKMSSTNTTTGQEALESRGLNFNGYVYWISLAALLVFYLAFSIGFTLVLTLLKPPGSSRAIISHSKISKALTLEDSGDGADEKDKFSISVGEHKTGRMVLPFVPLAVAFQDLQYYVDTPMEMRRQGFDQPKLQLLQDITGAFRPGFLTALMGVSGAGKTTLLDVLAGRKTSGYVEGNITISGHPKVQETFTRISGYCEQTDIHSPQITVEESLIFSASLRLDRQITSKTKAEFVKEVLETIELDSIKDALVGLPGISGLSNEQRKRLTIAVELVANPSIIFMDEPTTGLDARAAAIVMRAVRNVADTGRTTVCTIHQPSIDIFETFDELILLKRGGRIIYSGPVGPNSTRIIEYFEGIPGVSKINNNYNPATWMLEVTSTSSEHELGVDFSQIYKDSALYQDNKDIVEQLSSPPPGSSDLHFPTRFAETGWGQFKYCIWKQHLSYNRSPSYNLTRMVFTLLASLLFGALFWKQGEKIENQQNLFNIVGSMYVAAILMGINNCVAVMPYVATERSVMYRERFAGMYSSWAYALAQVIIELPYIFIQTVIYVVITYSMMGYYASAFKVFCYFISMFCTLLYFNYMGMLLVSVTPDFMVATVLCSGCFSLLFLFSGFLIPGPQIPKWWAWLYRLTPSSWTLNVLLTSQFGDLDGAIRVFGETTTIKSFLADYFGFHHDHLAMALLVLIAFPLVLALLFSFFVGRLNFQRR